MNFTTEQTALLAANGATGELKEGETLAYPIPATDDNGDEISQAVAAMEPYPETTLERFPLVLSPREAFVGGLAIL